MKRLIAIIIVFNLLLYILPVEETEQLRPVANGCDQVSVVER